MLNLLMLFLIPFASAIICFLLPTNAKVLKKIAFGLSLIPLFLLVYGHSHWIGSYIEKDWIPLLSIQFYLRVDHLSLVLLYLVAVIVPISLLAVDSNKLTLPQLFFGLVLLLQGLLIGFFTARDLALFTIFWEAMLLPLYFIINLWGGPNRQTAAMEFLIYMIAGSVLMIVSILLLYLGSMGDHGTGTFNIDALKTITVSIPNVKWLGAIFLLAFAVKTPLFPFHAWLPDAYYQAPTSGTILLSALLSKAGIYGFLRIGMELFPFVLKEWNLVLLGLSITGMLYGALAAWAQNDFKRLIAYSSFSHVNFILVGIFAFTQISQEGAIIQAINHGITITALFLVAGWLEERLKSTMIGDASGLAKFMPHLCWLTLFFVLASVALPGTNNFIGEFLIFLGLFTHNVWLTAILAISIIFSVMYMLRWMQKVYFESPTFFQNSWVDIKLREFLIAAPLVALILWIGIYPAPVLNQIKPAAEKMISVNKEPT